MTTRNFTILDGSSSHYVLNSGVTPAHIKMWVHSDDGTNDGLPAGAPAVTELRSKLLEWDYSGGEITTLGYDGTSYFGGVIYNVEFYDNTDTLIHSWSLDGDGVSNETDSVGGNPLTLSGIDASHVISMTKSAESKFLWESANYWQVGDLTLDGTNGANELLINYDIPHDALLRAFNFKYSSVTNTATGQLRFRSGFNNSEPVDAGYNVYGDNRLRYSNGKLAIYSLNDTNMTGSVTGIEARLVIHEINPLPAKRFIHIGDSITFKQCENELFSFAALYEDELHIIPVNAGVSGSSAYSWNDTASVLNNALATIEEAAEDVYFIISFGTNPDPDTSPFGSTRLENFNYGITQIRQRIIDAGYLADNIVIANKTASDGDIQSGVEPEINTSTAVGELGNNELCRTLSPNWYNSPRPLIDYWTTYLNGGVAWLEDLVHPNELGRKEMREYTATQMLSALTEQTTNQAPIANAGANQSVEAGSTFTLDGSASTDTDGTIVEYRWTQTAGDTVVLDLTDPIRPVGVAPSTANAQTLTFSLVTVDDDWVESEADTVDIDVAAEVQNDVLSIIDKISFTFESDGMITAFPGRANRETFRLKPSEPTGLILDEGWFDFEANDVRRVEISILEPTGVKIISSDTDSITIEKSKLHARMGDMPIKSTTKEFEPTVSVFIGADERGVVMAAPGLSGAPKVKYYATTARVI